MTSTPFIIIVMTSEMVDEPLTRYTLARVGETIYNDIRHAMTA